jgi:hypothetical protein
VRATMGFLFATNKPYLTLSLTFCLFAISLPLKSQAEHPSNKIVKVACDPWPPWIKGNEGELASGGLFIEITEKIFSVAGLKAAFHVFPFKVSDHFRTYSIPA